MDHYDSNKRFKSANGSPITLSNSSHNPAASLPAYQPPAAIIGARSGGGVVRYVMQIPRSLCFAWCSAAGHVGWSRKAEPDDMEWGRSKRGVLDRDGRGDL